MFLGVEETVVGSLLYCGVTSFGDCTCPQHHETTVKFSRNMTSSVTVGAKRKAR